MLFDKRIELSGLKRSSVTGHGFRTFLFLWAKNLNDSVFISEIQGWSEKIPNWVSADDYSGLAE